MNKTLDTHLGKNATETAVRMIFWRPDIGQDVLRYIIKCMEL